MRTLQEPDAPVAAPLDDQALAALLRQHQARLGQFLRHRALNALRRRRRAAAALGRLAGRARQSESRDPADAVAVRDLLLRTLAADEEDA